MKLDASALRYLGREDFRILSAIEIGSKNHEVVPLSMIASLCRMRPGGVNARLSELSKYHLVSKEHYTSYEGFRLTYGGYDYLALHALSLRGSVEGVGRQIGVGKESDIYLVTGHCPLVKEDEEGEEEGREGAKGDRTETGTHHDEELVGPLETFVLKIERLGRTSFRTVRTNRDYIGKRKHISWMFLSRLAAEKEWTFLRALHQHGFPTPKPIDWNRHCIVMEWVKGRPLEQLHREDWPENVDLAIIAGYLYELLMRMLVKLAEYGLIHGDFNEFNIMIKEEFVEDPIKFIEMIPLKDSSELFPEDLPFIMIDFPQMVSTLHINAKELFDRDATCLRLFFSRRFGFEATEWPDFERDIQKDKDKLLDTKLCASGFRNIQADPSSTDEDGDDDEDEDGDSVNDGDENGDDDSDNLGNSDSSEQQGSLPSSSTTESDNDGGTKEKFHKDLTLDKVHDIIVEKLKIER